MSVVWLVLSILGWTVLGILALVAVALAIPGVLELELQHGVFNLSARWFVLNKVILPASKGGKVQSSDEGEKKGKPHRQPDAAEETGLKKERQSKPARMHLDWNFLWDMVDPSLRSVRMILRKIRLRHVRIVTVVRADDVDQVGIQTGRRWATIGVIAGHLNARCSSVQYDEVQVIPDFTRTCQTSEVIACHLVMTPYTAVFAALVLLFRAIKPYARMQNDMDTHES